MADAFSPRPESSGLDGPPRPPTFVQIRAPAAPGSVSRKLGILGVGLALMMALGWAVHRVTDEQGPTVVTQAAPRVTDAPSRQHVVTADLYAELSGRAIDAAVSTSAWSQQSLMDRVSPFDPSVPDRMPSSLPPTDTAHATHAELFEISVRLGKGETIASALQKLGFGADAIADVISAVAPHIRLKRLPIGLGMTVQIRPSEEGTKPSLQALTLHPEGCRDIEVVRDGDGNFTVEHRERSSVR
jgi:hypothetical protein